MFLSTIVDVCECVSVCVCVCVCQMEFSVSVRASVHVHDSLSDMFEAECLRQKVQ